MEHVIAYLNEVFDNQGGMEIWKYLNSVSLGRAMTFTKRRVSGSAGKSVGCLSVTDILLLITF